MNERCPVLELYEEEASGNENPENDKPEASANPSAAGSGVSGKEPSENEEPRPNRRAIRSGFRATKTLCPVDLLSLLQFSIEYEVPALCFDYFSFHRTCWCLLRRIQQQLNPLLVKYFNDRYIQQESKLSSVVGCIFMAEAESAARIAYQIAKMSAAEMRGNMWVCELLMEAGSIVEDFLRNVERDTKEYGVGYEFPGTGAGR